MDNSRGISTIVGVLLVAGGLTMFNSTGASAAVSNSGVELVAETARGSDLGAGDLETDWAGRINAVDAV